MATSKYSRLQLAYLFKTYFDMVFFLCYSPFRFILKQENGNIHYVAKSPVHQKIMCTIFLISTNFWLIRDLIISFPHKSKSPSTYFEFLYTLSNMISIFATQGLFWLHQDKFEALVNYMTSRQNQIKIPLTTRNSILLKKLSVYLLFVMCTGFAIVNSVGQIYEEAVSATKLGALRGNVILKGALIGAIAVSLAQRYFFLI